MNKIYLSMLLAVLLGATAGSSATAQQMMLQKAVVASGGGRTSSGTTTMHYTIGQPVVGAATNGTLRGMFGFWNSAFALTPTGVDGGTGAGAITSMRISPNPVESEAKLELTLARSGSLNVSIYDLNGKRVRTLYSGERSAGSIAIPFEAAGLSSGTYYVAVSTPGSLLQMPITVMR